MRKIVIATLTVFLLGTAALSTPAEARCWWNGYAWNCWHPHAWWGYHRHHYWGPYAYGPYRHGYGPYGYGWRY